MTAVPIDPDADSGRRAWLPCPKCDHGTGCSDCDGPRECATHWKYLLRSDGPRLVLQCPACTHVWTTETTQAERRRTALHSVPAPAADATEHGAITTIALGGHAGDVAMSPDGDRIYVSTADSVKVISRLHHIVGNIPTGQNTRQMTVSADGSHVYVTGYDGFLTIIDAAANTGRTVQSDPSSADAVSPDGRRLYSIHHGIGGTETTSWVSIRGTEGRFDEAVPIEGYATGLAVSPDGSRLYVAASLRGAYRQYYRGRIVVIDARTCMKLDTFGMRFAPDTVTVSPDGSRLYLTHYDANGMSILDPASGALTALAVHDAPIDLVVSPDGARIYVTSLHSVTVVDAQTATAESILVGDLPRRVRVSADSKRVFVTDFGNHTVWVLNAADHSVITDIDVGGHPEAIAVSPDGQYIYISDYWADTLTAVETASAASDAAGLD